MWWMIATGGLALAGDPQDFHVPEPMVFDLVRGLGAKRGELEANTLFQLPLKPGSEAEWAPEIEWAIRDGLAVEFEVPMVGVEVEALKVAGQFTFPEVSTLPLRHGLQVLVEKPIHAERIEVSPLWLFAARLDSRWSLMAMAGALFAFGPDNNPGVDDVLLTQNLSVFRDFGQRGTFGVETSRLTPLAGAAHLQITPQAHVQVRPHVRVQGGAGLRWDGQGAEPLLAGRLIVER